MSIVLYYYYDVVTFKRGVARRVRGVVGKGRTSIKMTVVRGSSVVTVTGRSGCPAVDMFGFRVTIATLGGVRTRGVPLSGVICVGRGRVLGGACDPLESGCPSRKVHVSCESVVGCAMSVDSGGAYS